MACVACCNAACSFALSSGSDVHHSVGWLLNDRPAFDRFGDTLNSQLYNFGTDASGINSSKSGLFGNGKDIDCSGRFGTG